MNQQSLLAAGEAALRESGKKQLKLVGVCDRPQLCSADVAPRCWSCTDGDL